MPDPRRGLAVRCVVVGLLVTLVSVLVVSGESPAAADDYGDDQPAGPGYYPDSTDQWYCFNSSVSTGNRPYINDSMAYLDTMTNQYDVYTSTCGTSTDNVWVNQDLNGSLGYAPCWKWANEAAHICDQVLTIVSEIDHFEAAGTCGASANQLVNNYVISTRHELGHSVGLAHVPYYQDFDPCYGTNPAANDAMVSDWIMGSPWTYWTYSTHHIAHINCFC